VDFYLSETRDREAAKIFLKKALANPDNRPPHVFARDGLRSYPAALRELQNEGQLQGRCRQRTRRYCNNRIESDHRHIKRRLRAMQGPRTTATAWAVIQGIEAVQMIRKGQVLGITRRDLFGHAWVFGALLNVD
jgi:transposase-like protein